MVSLFILFLWRFAIISRSCLNDLPYQDELARLQRATLPHMVPDETVYEDRTRQFAEAVDAFYRDW